MQELIQSGRIADIILLVMCVEIAAFGLLRGVFGRGPKFADVIGTLLAGLFLVGAMRNGLMGGDWTITAGFLLAALLAHSFDIWRRWVGP